MISESTRKYCQGRRQSFLSLTSRFERPRTGMHTTSRAALFLLIPILTPVMQFFAAIYLLLTSSSSKSSKQEHASASGGNATSQVAPLARQPLPVPFPRLFPYNNGPRRAFTFDDPFKYASRGRKATVDPKTQDNPFAFSSKSIFTRPFQQKIS